MATRPNVQPLAGSIKKWNLLVYADPGAGKTVLAGSDLKVLYLVPERDGIMSALTMGSKAQHVEVHTWHDLVNFVEYAEENPEFLDDFEVLSVDSLSEMQYLARLYALEVGREDKLRKQRDPDKMEIQDYGVMHEVLEGLVRNLNDLPINIFYTATAKKVADADENEFLVPDLQGKKDYGIAMKMAALMTAYGYLRVEEHEVADGTPEEGAEQKYKTVRRRVIYWEDSGTIRAKDRTNALRPFTVNANLQQIRRAIKGEMTRNGNGFIVKKDSAAQKVSAPKPKPVVKKAEPQASPKPEQPVDSQEPLSHTEANGDSTLKVAEKEASKDLDLDAVDA